LVDGDDHHRVIAKALTKGWGCDSNRRMSVWGRIYHCRLVALMGIPASAMAPKANLSGSWKIDAEASGMSPTAQSAGQVVKITQTDAGVTIEFTDKGKPTTMRVKADGSETSAEMPDGMIVKTSGKWDGEKLVVRNASTSGDGKPVERIGNWYLKDGNLVMENAAGGRIVYKRVN